MADVKVGDTYTCFWCLAGRWWRELTLLFGIVVLSFDLIRRCWRYLFALLLLPQTPTFACWLWGLAGRATPFTWSESVNEKSIRLTVSQTNFSIRNYCRRTPGRIHLQKRVGRFHGRLSRRELLVFILWRCGGMIKNRLRWSMRLITLGW